MMLFTRFKYGRERAHSPMSYGRFVLLYLPSWFFWLAYCVQLSFQSEVRVREVMLALAMYSVILFVALSELLPRRLAAQLTSWRGEIWTKELDYVYLGLGVLGLMMSLGKIENVSDKFDAPGIFGAGLVATALVLRTIKTRAEIAGWNKLKNNIER
jgi:hypothetical protein